MGNFIRHRLDLHGDVCDFIQNRLEGRLSLSYELILLSGNMINLHYAIIIFGDKRQVLLNNLINFVRLLRALLSELANLGSYYGKTSSMFTGSCSFN
ncbi:hypothetical protein D3C73_1347840 [compost metagenome]